MNELNEVAKEWFAAKQVIVKLLSEIAKPEVDVDRAAEALIARLASHNPPILLETQK